MVLRQVPCVRSQNREGDVERDLMRNVAVRGECTMEYRLSEERALMLHKYDRNTDIKSVLARKLSLM